MTKTMSRGALRLLAHAGDLALRTGLPILRLDGDALRTWAERRTGLDDWGPDFQEEAFERVLHAGRTDARLNFVGRLTLSGAVSACLVGWLQLIEAAKNHPGRLEQPVAPMVLVLGLPRSGTTALHHLLCAHPDAMYLPLWLAIHPMPPPTADEWRAGGAARRRWRAHQLAFLLHGLIPDMERMHRYGPDLPVEDTYLTLPAFLSNQWGAWPLYSFFDWAETADRHAAYRCHNRHLQLMQHRLPGSHWILKSPGHLLGLEDLLEACPDAQIVMTHRDPAAVFGSLGSMMSAHHDMTSHHVDHTRMQRLLVRHFERGANAYVEMRESHPERFLDVTLESFAEDPLAVAHLIASRRGLRWDDEVEACLRAHLAARGKRLGRRHRYSLSQSGMTPGHVRRRFASYIEASGVQRDRP